MESIENIGKHLSFLRKKDLERSVFLRFVFTYIFSTDHKIIAKQYLFTGIFWAFTGALFSLIIRLQLGFPEANLDWLSPVLGKWIVYGKIDPEFYLKMVTVHGTIMIFFVLTSGFLGTFANYLIPLQIGAKDMASGTINMISYWLFFISGTILFLSLFTDSGAASSGWTMYPPLSILPSASSGSADGTTFWILSMVIFIISSILTSLNIITTVINLRTKGMFIKRLPLSVWGFLFTAILGLLTFPVLLSALILLFSDKVLHTSFYLSNISIVGEALGYSGGNPLLYQHLFWFLGHPEVYIAIFPAFGIVSEIISTNARKTIFGYPAMVTSMFAIMVLSFLVWAHHMFVSGMNPFLGSVFSLTSFVIAVPSSVKVFNWLTTLWKGNIKFTPAMLFAMGMVSVFITGGLTGLFVAKTVSDMVVHDTYFVVAHFHFVMGSASVFGFIAAGYYWFPRMFGKMLNMTLGYIHFWLTFIGVYLIFFPMHFLGLSGLPRRYYMFTYFRTFDGFSDINAFISTAAIITVSAQLILLFNIFYSLKNGKKAPKNPWLATTLEWNTTEGEEIEVHRWPYDYSVPESEADFIPQNVPDYKLENTTKNL